MDAQSKPVSMSGALAEYQNAVSDLTHENIMLKAYIKQLEDQLNQPTAEESQDA